MVPLLYRFARSRGLAFTTNEVCRIQSIIIIWLLLIGPFVVFTTAFSYARFYVPCVVPCFRVGAVGWLLLVLSSLKVSHALLLCLLTSQGAEYRTAEWHCHQAPLGRRVRLCRHLRPLAH